MAEMFPAEGEPAMWDEKREYICDELEVYFLLNAMPAFKTPEEWSGWVRLKKAARGEVPSIPADAASKKLTALEEQSHIHVDDQVWIRVPPFCTLGDVLKHPGHVAAGGMPSFYVYPRKSAPHRDFLKRTGLRVKDMSP